MLTIGEKIKYCRKEKGLTQKALGELCGMSSEKISQYERGIRNPKWLAVNKIARALNVSANYLLDC